MNILSIDSQVLNSIQSCARKTKYTFVDHLSPVEKAEPLERGDLMHKMLEIYEGLAYKCFKPESELFTLLNESGLTIPGEEQDKKLIARFAIECGRFLSGPMSLPMEEVEETVFQFAEYVKYYEYDPWHVIAVEQVGSKVIYEDEKLKIIYNFKVDDVRENGSITLPCDHKTSKRRQNPSSLSNQFIGYAFGIGSNSVMVNKIGFQKTLKPAERFERHILTYQKERINEWLENTIWWCKMLDFHLQSNHWPMNLTSCDKYGGCIYSEVCESVPDNRLWKIEKLFKEGEAWDVGKKLET